MRKNDHIIENKEQYKKVKFLHREWAEWSQHSSESNVSGVMFGKNEAEGTDGPMTPLHTHQVFGAVQLVRGRGAASDERLEHAAHHHRLHVLSQRLVVPRGEIVAKARLVWKQQGRQERPWMTQEVV